MAEMIYALTIAGFDGSAGAGFISDIKTMSHFGVYGQAVCTALTEQNEDEFVSPGWVIWERIEAQLDTLFKKHTFKYVKIGLVEKAKILKRVVEYIREKSPDAFIVWDPIASASAGFHFMRDAAEFLPVMKMINLVTPNADEYKFLGLEAAQQKGEIQMGKDCAVLLKGGHTTDAEAIDTLFHEGKEYKFACPRLPGCGKHGTGCVLSSAILSNVALGKSLPDACRIAKDYMNEFLKSGEGRLGFLPIRPNCKSEVDVDENSNTFTDPRDGQVYKTVKIGNQVWLAENFRYKCEGSYAYDDDDTNIKKFGRLYTWEAAKNCAPPGWHLPSQEEWNNLLGYVEANANAETGIALKSRTDWVEDADTPQGLDEFGFCALPAGHRNFDGGFSTLGEIAWFWTSTELDDVGAFYRLLSYDGENFDEFWGTKSHARSVRLLRD